MELLCGDLIAPADWLWWLAGITFPPDPPNPRYLEFLYTPGLVVFPSFHCGAAAFGVSFARLNFCSNGKSTVYFPFLLLLLLPSY